MSKRIARGAAETFDPTPEEVAKAERAKPTKRPLCIKCKSANRIEVWETVSSGIQQAFSLIQGVLTGQRDLSRAQVEKVRLYHELLCRASKARYCKHCVTNTVAYVLDQIADMKSAGTP